jgi:hypothetical protein
MPTNIHDFKASLLDAAGCPKDAMQEFEKAK